MKKGDSSLSPSAAVDRRLWRMKSKLRFTPSSSSGYVTAAREIIRVLQEADRYQRSNNICISLKFNPNTRRSVTLRRSSANSLVEINTPLDQTLSPLITDQKMVYRLTSEKKHAFMNQLWIPHKMFSIPGEQKVWLCSRSALCVAAEHWRPAESFGPLSQCTLKTFVLEATTNTNISTPTPKRFLCFSNDLSSLRYGSSLRKNQDAPTISDRFCNI